MSEPKPHWNHRYSSVLSNPKFAPRAPQDEANFGFGTLDMTQIVDAHHHIWRQKDVPWLQGPMVPRIFGPYEPIRRDYPISEYLADTAGSGVVQSVYVQATWAKDHFEDEVAWVQRAADETGWPHA